MLQIRVTEPDGSNPVILETAKGKKVSFVINSDDEGGSFSVPKNHPKADVLNPDIDGYTKFIEVWETQTNERIQYGPISSIAEKGTDWSVNFKGRSSLLEDFIDTRKTFYAPIDTFIDDLRYENIAIEPKTTALVTRPNVTTDQNTVFGTIDPDEAYAGLSKKTKDNVIDNQSSFRAGEIEIPNTYYTVDSYWAGMSRNDAIIVDLGEPFPIDRIDVRFPWWGGIVRRNNRSYDYSLAIANDVDTPLTTLQGRNFSPFETIYDSGNNNLRVDRLHSFTLGYTNSGVGYHFETPTKLDEPGPIDLRYIRLNIRDVNALYDNEWGESSSPVDIDWARQCDPDEVGGHSEGIEINDRELKPNNDCYASVLEVAAYKEIINRDKIKPLALQRIDNNNFQIKYYHEPEASETVSTDNGFREFEPGGFFRRFTVSWSGANTTYTKFFSKDCTNCYPDGFNFGIADQNNSKIYSSDSSSGTTTVKSGAFTSLITMKGASNATVTYVDAWPAKADPLSWGSQYSYTTIQDDYAILHFRGQSLKWYATIPTGQTGAQVKIEIRSKTTGNWSSWSTLEASYQLPDEVSASVVYEITYESGILAEDTVYEIKITNLDGNYCSIDSFEGYWSSSMSGYNDDSSRIFQSRPEHLTQIYDGRFNNGTMVKWNKYSFLYFNFEGDRVVILSAKGRNHGKASVYLKNYGSKGGPTEYGSSSGQIEPIPGGNADGGLTVDLDTGKRGAETPQFILFDSDDYFTSGLPWGFWTVNIVQLTSDIESYVANVYDTDNFVSRCQECKTPKGTKTIDKYIYFDSLYVHEKVGLSVSFDTQTHLEMIKSVAEAIQVEWEVREDGLRFEPRIGSDTNEILREGHNTLVDWGITNDVEKVSSMLFSSGADIDGLPLTTIVEDRKNRETLGRTVMRKQDFRETADYLQLIGLGRMELRRRRMPEKRITVTHIAKDINLRQGDSYILYTKKQGPIRVRIEHLDISEEDGREYRLECIRWPLIR